MALIVLISGCVDKTKEAPSISQSYKITVDYSQPSQMIAAGDYDWVDPYFNANNFTFPSDGVKSVEVVFFRFNHHTSSEDAMAEMDKAGYRPVDAIELFALGAQYSQLSLESTIVCLGLVWQSPGGYRYVPVIYKDGPLRELILDYCGDDWGADYRFAAVRNAL